MPKRLPCKLYLVGASQREVHLLAEKAGISKEEIRVFDPGVGIRHPDRVAREQALLWVHFVPPSESRFIEIILRRSALDAWSHYPKSRFVFFDRIRYVYYWGNQECDNREAVLDRIAEEFRNISVQ